MKIVSGTKLGRYEIRAKIGEGGMGEVYLADDTQLNRKVVVKVLRHDVTANPDRLRRLVQEAKTASALNQPNIITIYEIGESEGRPFIAAEYIEGQSLRERLSESSFDLRESLDIAIQVATALTAAHKAGVIHRDIKPENIMVRHDDCVKVVDFGLAKIAQPGDGAFDSSTPTALQAHTETGTVMGTVAYMSPEQARGLALDARTDIWSLGVVFYEMIAGRSPFASETHSDTIVAILQQDPPLLMAGKSTKELDWILEKALTKDRDDRYQTTREMLHDLKRLKQHLEVNRESESSPSGNQMGAPALTRAKTSISKWTLIGVASIILFALLAAGVAWKQGLFKPANSSAPVVVLMDSPLPDRVYDPETRKNGGTNADDITDILRDLPIVLNKENTSPIWHREDEVLREKPTLIVMHRSCFAGADPSFNEKSPVIQAADAKMDGFLGYIGLGNATTRFLVYTRREDDHGAWKSDLEKRFPQLKGRVFTLYVPGGPEKATFRDPSTAQMLRQQVQSILALH